ncbi:MAG: HD domain-containing protein [Clostridiales bacterium]|nr:HD domain-containing protein [Clostridiales bacterium]
MDYYKNRIDDWPDINQWRAVCQTLIGVRNDINHAAMNGSPSGSENMLNNLAKIFSDIKKLIDKEASGYNGNAEIVARYSDAEKIINAIITAATAHDGQFRKGTDTPYILHPLEVGVIASQIIFDPDLICAAFLHDAAEDAHMSWDALAYEFNDHVADLVFSQTEDKSKIWKERKQHTLDALKEANEEMKILTLADKLSNIRSIDKDYAQFGDDLWQRFKVKEKKEHAWYYHGICENLRGLESYEQFKELKRLVEKVFQ